MGQQVLSEAQVAEMARTIFTAHSVSKVQCDAVVQNMVWSELVGRRNFGVMRIPIHVERLKFGLLNPSATLELQQVSESAACMDADNAFGHFAGKAGMEKAIELASDTGIGIVTIKRSNWYGTGAYFVKLAADAGMISLALSNSFPKVAAFGGASSVFGTNPFAFGAPRASGDHLMVDFATSSLAGSTVRQYRDNGEQLPEGLATYPDGKPLTDPSDLEAGALLPFGGAKGYGIALLVEIMAGVLSGSGFSHTVKSTYSNFDEINDSGHCVIAIDIKCLMSLPDYYSRIETLVGILKASAPSSGHVRLPGEVRWENLRHNSKSGIEIAAATWSELLKVADEVGLCL
ncbi:MAG: Ldh family oxidoreductase [Pseudomonadota bacterium]